MSGPGFYWFAAKDFPPAFRKVPAFASDASRIKEHGQNIEDAWAKANALAQKKLREHRGRWLAWLPVPSIPCSANEFKPFNVRKSRT